MPRTSVLVGSYLLTLRADAVTRPSCVDLARRIARYPLGRCSALVVGCGCSLAALASARIGLDVTVCDQNPYLLDAVEEDFAANGLSCRVLRQPWARAAGSFDHVFVGDAVVDNEPVLDYIDRAWNRRGFVWLASSPYWPHLESFLAGLQRMPLRGDITYRNGVVFAFLHAREVAERGPDVTDTRQLPPPPTGRPLLHDAVDAVAAEPGLPAGPVAIAAHNGGAPTTAVRDHSDRPPAVVGVACNTADGLAEALAAWEEALANGGVLLGDGYGRVEVRRVVDGLFGGKGNLGLRRFPGVWAVEKHAVEE